MEHHQDQVNSQPVQINFPAAVVLPVIHAKKFAELNGLSEGVVGGWIDNGYLPTVKLGKYTMINLLKMSEDLKAGVV